MIKNLFNGNFDLNILLFNKVLNDAPEPWQIGFQDSAAPGFTGIVELHNTLFFYIVIICVTVFWAIGNIIFTYKYKNKTIANKYLKKGTIIELIWKINKDLILTYGEIFLNLSGLNLK